VNPDTVCVDCDAVDCRHGLIWGEEWHRPCPTCGGLGYFTVWSLSRRIDECDATMKRVLEPTTRMRPKVAARICGKLVDLVTPEMSDR
jgi:hypothetical protein